MGIIEEDFEYHREGGHWWAWAGSRRAKWLAQAILSDAIKRAVAWLATKIDECTEFCPVIDLKHGGAGIEIVGVTLACAACGLGVTCANGLVPCQISNSANIFLVHMNGCTTLCTDKDNSLRWRVAWAWLVQMGDLIEDLKDDSVVPCRPDEGDAALNAMFSAIPTTRTESGVLLQQMLAFKRDHTILTKNSDHQSFGATGLPTSLPTDPLPVVVKDAFKRKENEKNEAEKPAKRAKLEPKMEQKGGGTKRKRDDEIDDEKPAKRVKTHQRKAQEGTSKSAKKQPLSRPTTRRTHV
ncbi:hypothetical protein DFH09DRAFT_1113247 [Mycena vulgaris]|nr:hypothetical protein DFH09DRAFT_1113247 [Mycena vulgaris]